MTKLEQMHQIKKTVCRHYGVSIDGVNSGSRISPVALSRHVAMFLARTRLKATFDEIARSFGLLSTGTPMYAVKTVALKKEDSRKLAGDLIAIEAKLDEKEKAKNEAG